MYILHDIFLFKLFYTNFVGAIAFYDDYMNLLVCF